MRMQKRRMSILMNQAIVALFGILFCIVGIKKDVGQSPGCYFLAAGLLLLGLGMFRTWMVAQLMKKVESMGDDLPD